MEVQGNSVDHANEGWWDAVASSTTMRCTRISERFLDDDDAPNGSNDAGIYSISDGFQTAVKFICILGFVFSTRDFSDYERGGTTAAPATSKAYVVVCFPRDLGCLRF